MHHSETFGDINRLTLITSEEVHDIFADEEMPKFQKFRDEEMEEEEKDNNLATNSFTKSAVAAAVKTPNRKF